MIEGRVRRTSLLSQLLLLLMGILLLYLVVDFGRQVIASYQRQEELQQVERDIAAAQEETQRLEARLNYARSAQAAEAWAREQGWARQGEVPVVIIAPPASLVPEAAQEGQENPASLSPREAWWELFFGER